MNTWFTSDTHFDHAEIIQYCNRPFKDVEHMNEALIRNWNSRIKPYDFVIFLGDFVFKKSRRVDYFLDRLNGNITFLKGNHDHHNSLNTRIESLVVKIAGQEVFCTHNPATFNRAFKINLVGHVHDAWLIQKRDASLLVNMSVDVWKYLPVNINEILRAINRYKSESGENV